MKPTVSETRMRGLRLRLEGAHRGVERGEELVLDEHLAARERAHQRRLARVGVADERDAQLVLPRVPPVVLLLLDGGELLAQLGDAVADLAAVELDRGLAGALAALALLAAARLAHARRDVVEARDLDLQPRLAAARVAVEDLDDDAGAIEHLGAGRALEVARLARGDLVVDDDHRGLAGRLVIARGRARPAPARRRARRPTSRAPWSSPRARPTGTTPLPPVTSASSFSLPSPSTAAAASASRRCVTVATTSYPSVCTSRPELGEVGRVIDVGHAGQLHGDEHGERPRRTRRRGVPRRGGSAHDHGAGRLARRRFARA